jgi:hypothetical protein
MEIKSKKKVYDLKDESENLVLNPELPEDVNVEEGA